MYVNVNFCFGGFNKTATFEKHRVLREQLHLSEKECAAFSRRAVTVESSVPIYD